MKHDKSKLGSLGRKVLSLGQIKNKTILQLGECAPLLGITLKQERELLSRLTKSGYIIRIKRGTYLLPRKLPPGGKWSPSEYYVISIYMKLIKANYLICGPAAFQYYGLSEQVPNRIAIYNDKISGLKQIGAIHLQFIKVPKNRIGSLEKIKVPDSDPVYIATLARTLMDSIYDWSRFNTLPRAYSWIKCFKDDDAIMAQLVEATLKYSNVSTKRRLGYILEKLDVDKKLIDNLFKSTPQAKGWIPLNPRALDFPASFFYQAVLH